MELTVAICTHNRAELLRRTLECLAATEGVETGSWEVIVVANACTDNTRDVVSQAHPSLPVSVVEELRPGLSIAKNRALASARGQIVVWLDDDIEVGGEWLAAVRNAFVEFDADIVFGRIVPVWLEGQPRWFGPMFMGQFGLLDYGAAPIVACDVSRTFFGASVAYSRRSIDDLGGFREDLGLVGARGGGGEDTEMFSRALSRGLRIVYDPRIVVGHMIPASRATWARQCRLAWQGGSTQFRILAEAHGVKCLWGVPRYLFRVAVEDLCRGAWSALSVDLSGASWRLIRLVRFGGLLKEGVVAKVRRRKPAHLCV